MSSFSSTSFSTSGFSTLSFDFGTTPPPTPPTTTLLGGKAYFAYKTPYSIHKDEIERKKLSEEIHVARESIDSAERDKALLEAKNQAALSSKKRKAALEIEKLKELQQLAGEILRLRTHLQALEAMKRQMDEEDDLIALLLSIGL